MCSNFRPVSLSFSIDLSAVFIRFSPLNLLSAEHVVTGRVHRQDPHVGEY